MQSWVGAQARSTERISAGNCRMTWIIFVSRYLTDDKIALLKQYLAIYLAELENAKVPYIAHSEKARSALEIVQILCRVLEVQYGQAIDPAGYPPSILIQY